MANKDDISYSKKEIDNKFIDLILIIISLFTSLFQSITIFLKKDYKIQKSIFFDIIDYIFRIWPREFWKKPSLFKIGIFLGAFIKYIFYKK